MAAHDRARRARGREGKCMVELLEWRLGIGDADEFGLRSIGEESEVARTGRDVRRIECAVYALGISLKGALKTEALICR